MYSLSSTSNHHERCLTSRLTRSNSLVCIVITLWSFRASIRSAGVCGFQNGSSLDTLDPPDHPTRTIAPFVFDIECFHTIVLQRDFISARVRGPAAPAHVPFLVRRSRVAPERGFRRRGVACNASTPLEISFQGKSRCSNSNSIIVVNLSSRLEPGRTAARLKPRLRYFTTHVGSLYTSSF